MLPGFRRYLRHRLPRHRLAREKQGNLRIYHVQRSVAGKANAGALKQAGPSRGARQSRHLRFFRGMLNRFMATDFGLATDQTGVWCF